MSFIKSLTITSSIVSFVAHINNVSHASHLHFTLLSLCFWWRGKISFKPISPHWYRYAITPCGHQFCLGFFIKAYRMKPNCPICQDEMITLLPKPIPYPILHIFVVNTCLDRMLWSHAALISND